MKAYLLIYGVIILCSNVDILILGNKGKVSVTVAPGPFTLKGQGQGRDTRRQASTPDEVEETSGGARLLHHHSSHVSHSKDRGLESRQHFDEMSMEAFHTPPPELRGAPTGTWRLCTPPSHIILRKFTKVGSGCGHIFPSWVWLRILAGLLTWVSTNRSCLSVFVNELVCNRRWRFSFIQTWEVRFAFPLFSQTV